MVTVKKTPPLPIGTRLEHIGGEQVGTIVAYTLEKRDRANASHKSGAPWKYRVSLAAKNESHRSNAAGVAADKFTPHREAK